jgi:hypothetical protein
MIRLATQVGSRGNKVIKAGGGINGDKTEALALMSIGRELRLHNVYMRFEALRRRNN